MASAACIGVLAFIICDAQTGGFCSVGILTGKFRFQPFETVNDSPALYKGYKTTAVQGIVDMSCIPAGSSLYSVSPIAMFGHLKYLAGGLYLTGVGAAGLGSYISVHN